MFILTATNSIANDFLRELRDRKIQSDRMRFRKNLERLGEIMAYEVSKKIQYRAESVQTPLGKLQVHILTEQPVIVTVMRAGLPFFQGFINYFDKADCGFIGAYRQESAEHLTIKLEYLATPDLTGRIAILVDPMLATGRSVIDSLNAMKKNGTPSHLHIVSLVAAPEGLDFIKKHVTIPFSVWTCAVDEKLDENYYIVPGLGDAGDLSFGEKI
jgi:uracil phosphoribosyltransferase